MQTDLEILAVIPARGRSKGILRKNLQPLVGLPLIAHTIQAALAAPAVTRLVVSTDDPEIGSVAERYGAEVVWRPADISGDQASSESALLHVLDHLHTTEGYQPDLLVFLQCTSPLTSSTDIQAAIQVHLDQAADTTLSATPFHYFLWREDEQGETQGINHDKHFRPLRQERPPQYLETGAIYIMDVPGFLQTRHRFFGKTALYIQPPERVLEIDEPIDLTIAEVMLREQQREYRLDLLPNPVAALVLDFDGVFTDNRALLDQGGQEAVFVHRGDGMGLERLKRTGLPILVLSSEPNPVVRARCAKLGLECQQGLGDKRLALLTWLAERDLPPENVIYLGNDLNDLGCLRAVGCPVVVADAHPQVRPAARLILDQPGGWGAIRQVCELIIEKMERT